jgi:Ni,Fe-hydrogenase III large subunit
MHDLFGVTPTDHPLPRRLVRHGHWPKGWYPMRRDAGPAPSFTTTDPYPFAPVEGEGVYEIPVGPVHAGLIEPGHFRFSVVGETILKLKVRLWFVHRGVEKLFEGRDPDAATQLAERISGDTSLGHCLAYCMAVENALGIQLPAAGVALRAMLLELERMYNHVADMGALANDVGYGIANAHALRIRETLLRLNAAVTGHRLLRGAVAPGQVRLQSLPDPERLAAIAADVDELAELTLRHSTVRDRFTGTAVLNSQQAQEIGCLGYVARASGLALDARYESGHVVKPITFSSGDVLARYQIRRAEFAQSVDLIARLRDQIGPLAVSAGHRPPQPRENVSGTGIVEGWRGTIATRVEIDHSGRLSRVKPVDPSWFNWPALPVALRETIVPDFPLVNKSFNLSYAGNDL